MMNLRRQPHHKICRLLIARGRVAERPNSLLSHSSDAGYAVIALLAFMTLLALFATAAAPSIYQQAQREREKETIFRGEQVADALRDYYIYRSAGRGPGDQSLPTSIDDLLEGIPITGGSRKRQILRASAARETLSTSGEWRLVRPRSPNLIDFQRSVMVYAGNVLPQPSNPQLAQLQQFAAPPIIPIGDDSEEPTRSEVDSSADSSGPFVGVSSRSSRNSVLLYYGIDRHDQWIFTPLFR